MSSKDDNEKEESKRKEQSVAAKIFGELAGYGFFLLFIYTIFPRLNFITAGYYLWRPIALWTTTLGLVFKIFKHGTRNNPLARILEIGELSLAIYSTYWLIQISPVDFSRIGFRQFNDYFAPLMYLVIFAMFIALTVNFVKIFFPEKKK